MIVARSRQAMNKIISQAFTKSFGNNEVLKDNFSVSKGEVVCIIGASGSGKPTLLRCLNLLEYPTSGEILYHGTTSLNRKCPRSLPNQVKYGLSAVQLLITLIF